MPQPGRHAAPRDPARRRAVLLPSVLLTAAGAAFGGMAFLPAAAAQEPQRVTAAAALAPVELPVPVDANLALATTLQKGAAAAAPPPATPPRASRSRTTTPVRPPVVSTPQFVRPGTGRLTSGYGRRWGRLHAGIDLAAGVGAPIRAVTSATVVSAGWDSGYGRAVRLRHSDGTVSLYGHMSAILVSVGEKVAAGEQIGREGNTGNSTGPHLHFEIRINGTPINPATWLRARGVRV